MASVYTNDLRLEEIGSGEQSGTWGDTTNTNLELIAEALSFGTEAITTNADTHTSTVADGAADAARAMYIKYTGTLDSTCTITIGPNTISRVHIIENATSGSQSIIISQGSGANVTIGTGAVKMVYLDGAGSGAAVTDALVDLDLTGTTTIAAANISGDLDVDGTANLDVVDIDGAVDMASTLAVAGVVTANAGVVVDNITIDGTEIDLSSGDFTLDVANNIILDSGDGDFEFRDTGTTFLNLYESSNTAYFYNPNNNADIVFQGKDDNSVITAFTLDMSEAGAATFNSSANFGGAIAVGQSSLSGGSVIADFHTSGSGVGTQLAFANDHNTDKFFVGLAGNTTGNAFLYQQKDANIEFYTNNSLKATLDNNGNLGIGGTPNVYSGYTSLTLNHATNGGILDFEKNGTLVGELFLPDVNTFAVTAVGAKAVSFNTNSAERMRISSAGNIGIGTTSPSDPLVVSDSGASSVTARLINTNADGNPANLRLQKLSGSPADGDYIGMINVSGENSASEEIIFQSIDFISTDVSDGTEDGDIAFRTRGAGTLAEKMRISSNGDVSLNNGGSNTNLRLQNTNSGSGSTDGFLLQHATNAITYVWNYENAATVFGTNSTERMRISSAGLVGIGTTSPSAGLTIEAADGSTSGTVLITATSVASAGIACNASGLNFGADTGGFVFKTGASAADPTDSGTERLSINSSGVIQLGTALTFGGTVNVNANGIGVGESGSSGSYRRMYWNESNNDLRFWNGSNEGIINSSGAFVDASDVNLKKDIADIEYGIDTVKSLKPRKYKMKDTNLEQIGFVAQEMETQVPEIVSTGVNPDGDEQKGIAYGQLTAVLTKALQEAIAKIETLETKVKALEGE